MGLFYQAENALKLCSEGTCFESRLKHSVAEIFRGFLILYGRTPQLAYTIFKSFPIHYIYHPTSYSLI
jgi:hypothetical protein